MAFPHLPGFIFRSQGPGLSCCSDLGSSHDEGAGLHIHDALAFIGCAVRFSFRREIADSPFLLSFSNSSIPWAREKVPDDPAAAFGASCRSVSKLPFFFFLTWRSARHHPPLTLR